MATIRIPQDEVVFVVTNLIGSAVVVANARVNPNTSKEIPVRYIVGNIHRCQEMAALEALGHIGVQLKFSAMGLESLSVDSPYLLSLQASTGNPYGLPVTLPTTSLPAAGEVPEGFQTWDTTANKPQYWDGAAWKDGTGA